MEGLKVPIVIEGSEYDIIEWLHRRSDETRGVILVRKKDRFEHTLLSALLDQFVLKVGSDHRVKYSIN